MIFFPDFPITYFFFNLINFFIGKSDLGETTLAIAHPLVLCDSCDLMPIRGPRFTCRVCEEFNLCQQCFNSTSTGHCHPFNRIGHPGNVDIIALTAIKYLLWVKIFISRWSSGLCRSSWTESSTCPDS